MAAGIMLAGAWHDYLMAKKFLIEDEDEEGDEGEGGEGEVARTKAGEGGDPDEDPREEPLVGPAEGEEE